MKFFGSKSVKHLSNIHVMDEYETPWNIFEEIKVTANVNPVLDVCATNGNTKCPDWFNRSMDGLMQDWKKDFWMNPPYSEVGKWVKKAYEESNKWNVTGTALTYSKTDTKWWHEYVLGHAELNFLKGRVNFFKDGTPVVNKNPKSKQFGKLQYAPYPSVVLVWRKR